MDRECSTRARARSRRWINESALGVTATGTAQIKLHWNQAATVGTAFDPNLVRQGRSLDPSDSYARTLPGTMSVDYVLSNLHVSWDGIGPVNLGSPSYTTSGTCDVKAGGSDYVCHLASSQIGLLDPGFPYVGPYVRLELDSDVTVTPEGLATVRDACAARC